uniref:Integrase catalytic domain-containing protein n=1 Tax=Oreochromis aureus TaxID=47969 RepID=A0AAZ1XXP0_OREAU
MRMLNIYVNSINIFTLKILECDQCQKVGKPLTAVQPLQCIQVSEVRELIGIDLTGPLPKTSSGFQYILTATDYFSKWVEAFPLKTKSASEVAQHLCSIIYRHGCPKRILSDQGREFVNELNSDLCKLLQIERSVTAAYHPQTNGLDEKTNDNIKRALRKLVNDQQNNWDLYLDPTLFSLRSKVHTTTKYSPFFSDVWKRGSISIRSACSSAVKWLWAAKDTGRVEAVVGPYKLYDSSFRTLEDSGWLSDEVIDAYLHCLIRKQKEPVYQLSCVVATSLFSGKFKCVTKMLFPAEDIWLCPLNFGAHWILVVVKISSRSVLLLDPLGNEGCYERKIMRNWRNFLKMKGKEESRVDWKMETLPHSKQMDSSSCGVLVLKFAEHYTL